MSSDPPTAQELAQVIGADSRAAVLVEGMSDRLALQALAARRGRNLDAEGFTSSQ